ncbi:glycoside hydrolase family 65 protein [Neobacillus notoginsengisoli]|uniref:Glycoside hydrolase family 65 protein n=1 Tax=Neobacillus notoginsengisoli TaxID=1578198 RepID=A0A417YYC1_9BACI|nr:glycoside hydrolase family 65 protein [Neobacillus notoginsengisoli]RHW42635.1 glycoside hydrolase family 65 protein [Neobacillus notoginsengisoli]
MKKVHEINEEKFKINSLNKYASLMALGNGYMGTRSALEEDYPQQVRGMYVSGIYNKAYPEDSSDIVNLPDVFGVDMIIDGEPFSLLSGEILSYNRTLHMQTGEMTREVKWKNRRGKSFLFKFQRFVSKANLHLLASKITVTPLADSADIQIETGINGQQTNFGKQHLVEENVRVYDEKVMFATYRTSESGHKIAIAACCDFPESFTTVFLSKNRKLTAKSQGVLYANESAIIEKTGSVYTSLDKESAGQKIENLAVKLAKEAAGRGYHDLLASSGDQWEDFWKKKRVEVNSLNHFDQTALDFALYHMEIMTPGHDERFSVGAKGLTGEGYKGHVFWDTEIFIKPFHLLTEPEKAKKLLQYRYDRIEQAKEKARMNGYDGALFPWESAFSGKEETPEFAAINIRTGLRQRVASAAAEHHIVADIAFAVVHYYLATGDEAFMRKEGLALLRETSLFWISRTTEENGRLSIKDVIGPDEYTEHIDNNAYTNYLAYFNVQQAIYYMEQFQMLEPAFEEKVKKFLKHLYLPLPNDDKIIPQDDTFLHKPDIDLSKYKEVQGSQAILLDYSRSEVNELQVLKQADVVMLFYLLPDLFSEEVIRENLHYYEERTIHDSSLSKAIHSIVAARIGILKDAYRFFSEACLIDLGSNPHSSDEGIHAASLGSLWMSAIFGFANVKIDQDGLAIDPKLPKEWKELSFPLAFRGRILRVKMTQGNIEINKLSGQPMPILVRGQKYKLSSELAINY